jgi:actin-related protein
MQKDRKPFSTPGAGGGSTLPVFVLDIGTRTIKAGLHTSPSPHVTPSLIGIPKYPRCLPGPPPAVTSSSGNGNNGVVVGHEARRRRGLLRLSYPIENGGIITDWASARPLLRQSIQGTLAASATSDPIARALQDDTNDVVYSLVESPFASRPQRARLAELLFEGPERSTRPGPRAAGVFCGVGPLLALYATGQTTGLAVDVGDGGVSTAAAVDGYVLPLCLQHDRSGAAGAAVTSYLTRLLYQSGVLGPASVVSGRSGFSSSPLITGLENTTPQNLSRGATAGTAQERELVYDIKETCCSVATTPLLPAKAAAGAAATTSPSTADLNTALINAARRTQQLSAATDEISTTASSFCSYELPDGHAIHVGAVEAVQATEVLFYPSLLGLEGPGVVDAVLNAVAAAPVDVRSQLLRNIVVTGGATCSHGFGKRVFNELQQRLDAADATCTLHGQRVCVTAPEHRAHASWLGASFVAQLSTFATHMVVTRAAYEEEGEAALAKKVLT